MLKPVQLLALTVVVRTRSFTQAGRELGYTPSAVAQQISALERDLGVRLVDREPQRIRPTPAAYRLAERSQDALDLLVAVEQEAGALARGQLGRLSVGTALDSGATLVADSLSFLQRSRTGLDIRLEHSRADRLLDRVASGSVDIGVLYDFPSAPRALSDELRVQSLAEEPWQVVTPSRWRRAPALSELADHEWVVGLGSGGDDAWSAVCAALDFHPRTRVTTDNGDVVLGLVAAGRGVGVVPTLSWPAPGTVMLTPLTQAGATRCTIAVHRGGTTNPAVLAAIRSLRAAARSG